MEKVTDMKITVDLLQQMVDRIGLTKLKVELFHDGSEYQIRLNSPKMKHLRLENGIPECLDIKDSSKTKELLEQIENLKRYKHYYDLHKDLIISGNKS